MPYMYLLTLLSLNQAFDAASLFFPDHLFRLRGLAEQNRLPIPLRKAMGPIPLFRRSVATVMGTQI